MAVCNTVPRMHLPGAAMEVLHAWPICRSARKVERLTAWPVADAGEGGWYEVAQDVPGTGRTTESRICRLRNGAVSTPQEPGMRRRGPVHMLIGDKKSVNEPR